MLDLPFEPPVQKIDLPVFKEHHIHAAIKREDLIHPFISGNKWRKLKYVLEDARKQNKDKLISFGGAYSNHLVALSCAGAMHGFETTAFVRGEKIDNPMLGICKTYGMKLHFVTREVYKDKTKLYNSLETDKTYFIDEGGRGELAAKGCEEILENVSGYSHVICAIGTGTTFAGIVNAAVRKNIRAEGICVLKGAEPIEEEVEKWTETAEKNWHIHHQFHGGGYAKSTPDLYGFIDRFAAQTGILLDQVYTAKMMLGVIQLVEQGYFKENDRLLLIHTGGLLGLLSRYS